MNVLEWMKVLVLVFEMALAGFVFTILVPWNTKEPARILLMKSVSTALVMAVVVIGTFMIFNFSWIVALIVIGPGFFGGMVWGYLFGQRVVDFLLRLLVSACE